MQTVMEAERVDEPQTQRPAVQPPRVAPWFWRSLVVAAVVAVCTVLVADEATTDGQTARTHHALAVTLQRLEVTRQRAALLRSDLRVLSREIGSSTHALTTEQTGLHDLEMALGIAHADSARQAAYMRELSTCKGGVQQALNALSVGDRGDAVASLNEVASACSDVDAASN